ncbi:hypothetical protein KZ483_16140 [Paenibacillus sp. sptzw28]|uniref:hypothetical protein n=1 Tax=Paenibacillus sp. sptzw28 TaxID=715179 RepID=UPI001C6DF54B|nr:hypothetical protein [Paenibacillus sp. sptzw28]QYR19449.1 hypothetical protein KZ483_16140 [Paenibacillus sp. sptzw28]
MKQLVIMTVLAFILAGCSSASENSKASGDSKGAVVTDDSAASANDGEKAEGKSEETSAQVTEAKGTEEVKEAGEGTTVTNVTDTKETAAKEVEKEQPASTKGTKQTKEINKAVVENKETNAAVTGSIMDKKEPNPPSAADAGKKAMEESVKNIRTLAKDLKQKAEAGDAEGVKMTAAQTLQSWDNVKNDIKSAAADMYSFLDEKMTKLAEQIKAEEIDMEAVIQIDYQIYQGFRQLAEKMGIE